MSKERTFLASESEPQWEIGDYTLLSILGRTTDKALMIRKDEHTVLKSGEEMRIRRLQISRFIENLAYQEDFPTLEEAKYIRSVLGY